MTRSTYGAVLPALAIQLGLLLSVAACGSEGRGTGADAGPELTPSDSIPEAFHEIPETPADLPAEEEDVGLGEALLRRKKDQNLP